MDDMNAFEHQIASVVQQTTRSRNSLRAAPSPRRLPKALARVAQAKPVKVAQ